MKWRSFTWKGKFNMWWRKSTLAAMVAAVLGLVLYPNTALANNGVGGDGSRSTLSDGQVERIAPGASVTAVVVWIIQGGNAFKALSCSLVADNGDHVYARGEGTVNSFPGEMQQNCWDKGFVLDEAPPMELSYDLRTGPGSTTGSVAPGATTGCNCPPPAPASPSGPFTQVGSGGYREFGPVVQTTPGMGGTWTVEIPSGMVLYIGAFELNGRDRGVYTALMGPQTVTIRMTDGEMQLMREGVARDEFCRRVAQARRSNWAVTYVEPLAWWPAC